MNTEPVRTPANKQGVALKGKLNIPFVNNSLSLGLDKGFFPKVWEAKNTLQSLISSKY